MREINVQMVKEMVKVQFPQWSDLEVSKVKVSGHDNRTFHLGDKMSARFPSAECYVAQVEKEQKWLPKLKGLLPLPIPSPIAKGEPYGEYLWPWSINLWIDGEAATRDNVKDFNKFAIDLAKFLIALQSVDSSEGPMAGSHNFYRGGELAVYHDETIRALKNIGHLFNGENLEELWMKALKTKYKRAPVWVHGDVAQGNLLVKNGELCAVIDFGILGVGDPACDLAIAWTYLPKESQKVFKEAMMVEEEMWLRGKAWALWKALITIEEYYGKDENKVEEAKGVIYNIVND